MPDRGYKSKNKKQIGKKMWSIKEILKEGDISNEK